jgi:DNA-binding PucR family transcriptional regulator
LLESKPSDDEGRLHKAAADLADVDGLVCEKDQATDRTQQIIAYADELRVKVEEAREEIAKKKAVISRRKSELATASNGIERRRTRQTEEVEKSIRMTKYKWNQTHSVTASSRAFLCGEAAKLYGLRRVRRNGGLEEYRIG